MQEKVDSFARRLEARALGLSGKILSAMSLPASFKVQNQTTCVCVCAPILLRKRPVPSTIALEMMGCRLVKDDTIRPPCATYDCS